MSTLWQKIVCKLTGQLTEEEYAIREAMCNDAVYLNRCPKDCTKCAYNRHYRAPNQ